MSQQPDEQESAADSTHQLTFEQAIEQLEQLIEKIESGEVGLEAALKHYEEGTQLIKRCRSILDSAEKRIAELTENEAGELELEGEGESDDPDSAGPSADQQ